MYNLYLFFICLVFGKYLAHANNDINPKIVGGIDVTDRRKFPYQVSLQVSSLDGKRHFCGGSIVNKSCIVTAAHCMSNSIHASSIHVQAGILRIGDTYESKRIRQIILHPRYNSIAFTNDIAIIKIKNYFTWTSNVAPIKLAKSRFHANTSCTVSGWGKLSEHANRTHDTLQETDVSILDMNYCKSIYGSNLAPGMMCAGFKEGLNDACEGDSGGGLVCNNTLTGVVSWGSGCARPNRPGIYTDVVEYSQWIEDTCNKSRSNNLISNFLIIFILTTLLIRCKNCV